jgi:hypothetical protein
MSNELGFTYGRERGDVQDITLDVINVQIRSSGRRGVLDITRGREPRKTRRVY